MSLLPSPLKSPTCTSTHSTAELHVSHRITSKAEPVERFTTHWPLDCCRPTRSITPSPLKSPTLISTQVTAVDQFAHHVGSVNALPVEALTHQSPATCGWLWLRSNSGWTRPAT